MFFNRNKQAPKQPENPGVVKSVFLAYFILVLHALLVLGLGGAVLFFGGLVHFMPYIFFGGTALIIYSGYRFFQKLKRDGKSLSEVLSDPMISGKEVEVSFLGGLVSVRMDGRAAAERLAGPRHVAQLEDPDAMRLRELKELAELFEKNLITAAEYHKAKQGLLK
ncbi:hypothetical protein SAMN02745216_00415 [Desulfatibacillum alkenivorans DSM 16219]|jgi:hypothetical protein|uniref:Short C-terminal domain-containing protein n=1 Tax=Desulfatibacillum alkenivorans DSM 16219 TaxID=1121393 RepID=A0A1M6DNK4_9BACT|nr:SHOCT domain-containing protein [Desulfatibacillum alkenivorans]SHI74719.1 hypothetical protein SAMN02745216_00415 [Desulfatibacillum alkenivorans DSM 16219]